MKITELSMELQPVVIKNDYLYFHLAINIINFDINKLMENKKELYLVFTNIVKQISFDNIDLVSLHYIKQDYKLLPDIDNFLYLYVKTHIRLFKNSYLYHLQKSPGFKFLIHEEDVKLILVHTYVTSEFNKLSYISNTVPDVHILEKCIDTTYHNQNCIKLIYDMYFLSLGYTSLKIYFNNTRNLANLNERLYYIANNNL